MKNIIAIIMKVYLNKEEYEEVLEYCRLVEKYAEVALMRLEKDAEKCKSIKESN